MKEIYKDIEGYEGLYQISNFGNVKSLDRMCKHSGKGLRTVPGKLLKKSLTFGYEQVNLYKDNKAKTHFIHRLVIGAFSDKKSYKNEIVINHIDGIKTNNNLDNLEIIPQRENVEKGNLCKNKSSIYPGVYLNKISGKYVASLRFKNERYHIGTFDDEYTAYMARNNKLKELQNG